MKKYLVMAAYILSISTAAFSHLLSDTELNEKNYATVRIWNSKKLTPGGGVGHAALQIYENDQPLFNASLYPNVSVGPLTRNEVEAYWQTAEEDTAHGQPNQIIYLYSVNRRMMKDALEKMKEKSTYYMISTGGNSSIFVRDYEFLARNCASMVRELLNEGGLKNLFDNPMDQSALRATGSLITHAIPGGLKTAGEIASGLAGGILGSAGGFLKGVYRFENPFRSSFEGLKSGAVEGARLADFAANKVFWGGGCSEEFSTLNYGHPYGECQIVTPWKVAQLAKDARAQEQKKFSRTASWKTTDIFA